MKRLVKLLTLTVVMLSLFTSMTAYMPLGLNRETIPAFNLSAMAAPDSTSPAAVNIWVAADDYADVYVDEGLVNFQPALTYKTSRSMLVGGVDEDSFVAVKARDLYDDGTANISGFRLVLQTGNSSYIETTDEWYYYYDPELTKNEEPPMVDGKRWIEPDYAGVGWLKATEIDLAVAISNGSNPNWADDGDFPIASDSKWIWSSNWDYTGGTTRIDTPIFLRSSAPIIPPVFFDYTVVLEDEFGGSNLGASTATVEGALSATVEANDSVNFEELADSGNGYYFIEWLDATTRAVVTPPTVATESGDYIAVFGQEIYQPVYYNYSVVLEDKFGGSNVGASTATVEGALSATVEAYDSVSFEELADSGNGYYFIEWLDATTRAVVTPPTIATESGDYIAVFGREVEQVTITIVVTGNAGSSEASANGYIATQGSSVSFTVDVGTKLTFDDDEASGYDFDGWSPSELPVEALVTATYEANFSKDRPGTTYYDLDVTQDGEGYVESLGGKDRIRKSTNYNLGEVEAAEGWIFLGFGGADGDEVKGPDADGNYSIYMDSDKRIIAEFLEEIEPPQSIPVDLVVKVDGEGNIIPYTQEELDQGTVVTFGPLEGSGDYEFISISAIDALTGDESTNLVDLGNNTYELLMDVDKEVTIVFETDIFDAVLPETGGLPMGVSLFGGFSMMIAGFKMKKKRK